MLLPLLEDPTSETKTVGSRPHDPVTPVTKTVTYFIQNFLVSAPYPLRHMETVIHIMDDMDRWTGLQISQ